MKRHKLISLECSSTLKICMESNVFQIWVNKPKTILVWMKMRIKIAYPRYQSVNRLTNYCVYSLRKYISKCRLQNVGHLQIFFNIWKELCHRLIDDFSQECHNDLVVHGIKREKYMCTEMVPNTNSTEFSLLVAAKQFRQNEISVSV